MNVNGVLTFKPYDSIHHIIHLQNTNTQKQEITIALGRKGIVNL